MHDLPLIIFTLAVQAAVGVFLWVTIARLRNQETPYAKTTTLTALILTTFGIIFSLFHLGKPLMAFTSLSKLFSATLSQEIFFSGGFFVLLAVAYYFERSSIISNNNKTIWSVLTSFVGLVAVYAMAKVYMTTIIPAWQSWNTLVDFCAATLILGALVYLLVTRKAITEKVLRIDLIILAVILVQMALVPSFMASLGATSGAAQQSAALMSGDYGAAYIIHWLLVLGGVFLIVISGSAKLAGKANILYVASGALVIGLFIGRYLFYATGVASAIGL